MGSSPNFAKTPKLSFNKLVSPVSSPHLRRQLRRTRSVYAVFSVLLLLLLIYNTATLFCTHSPFPVNTPPGTATPGNVAGKSRKLVSLSSSSAKLSSSSLMYAVKEDNLASKPQTHLSISSKNLILAKNSLADRPKRKRKHKNSLVKIHLPKSAGNHFSVKVKEFFNENSSISYCKQRFFMTWISSLEDFGEREMLTIESLFKSHPDGCLVIVSNAMDSKGGNLLLKPFSSKGYKILAISPDYNYLFKNTPAQSWISRLVNGKVKPGEVSIGQNLSNLLRLGLLYRFGGVYLDTDVIVLKSFGKLRNVIGAQTMDAETKNWSRLNNAVMIFDKQHPLIYMFIEEFALTFDGNRWGHNGPYLVSRVVSRVKEKSSDYDFTVLPPMAFYPVDWSKIGKLFDGPKNESHLKWLESRLNTIRGESFAVHLWNKQSRELEVEEGSIIGNILSDCCLFCNTSASIL